MNYTEYEKEKAQFQLQLTVLILHSKQHDKAIDAKKIEINKLQDKYIEFCLDKNKGAS